MLYDYSYHSLLLYGAATPQYDDEEEKWDESKDWNNPANNTDNINEDEEFVKEF